MPNKLIAILISLLCATSITAQNIYVPDQIQQPKFHISKSQKAVRTSTDIVALALPVATLTGVLIMQDWEGLKQASFTALTTTGATLLLKFTVNERRPDFSNHHSFPSAHTSASFATASFLQHRYGWKFGIPAYTLATYVAWGRCFSKRHHWWDVVAGAAIGTGSAFIFTTPFAKKHNLAIMPFTDGQNIALATSITF
ncbi:MAG: phosphatase PAP2 family protein [Prevotella sp.]|nr:phosphatase PAP2 family protein [Bacteroides sp.]MCM1366723.1 phosphatase PAP2 family protein [Prevotella sp.]MCM1437263.1 phosphatase PAP2 family protein [Prevotella sp.]